MTSFGAVLAHEMGHAWLAACPGGRDRSEEEGMCELVASWWLRERGGPLAAHLLDLMDTRPDPVYGDGYRRACEAAAGRDPAAIVRAVAATGHL
jgi:hypothetical protein